MKKSLLFVFALLALGAGCSAATPTPVTETMTQSDTTEQTSEDVTRDEMEGNGDMVTGSNTSTEVNVGVGATIDLTDSSENVVEVTVTGRNMSFDPKEIKVKKGDTVRVTFKNAQGFHDFVIDEFKVKTEQISAGQEEVVEFVADKTGSFEYYCSVGSHRKMGMWGTLIVE